ncbi:MAG TPA: DUF5011 domain-containing protein [Chitinophagaceae bacterium]|nr:DUF5011 domain-containing protein [Chitinophagaceae bacterium]
MKKNILLFITIVAIISSCKKDTVVVTADRVGISRVTYYVNITLTGGDVISIVQGSAFTDPGAKGEAGGQEVPVTATGNVDPSAVGLYTITYSATNKDGYSSTVTRTVVVIPSAESPGVDLSGTYIAVPVGTTPGPANITKVAPGVYYSTDLWTGAAVIPGYFICVDGSTLIVPLQNTAYGRLIAETDGTYAGGLITWTLTLLDQGPFTATKKWQKQ